MLAMALMEAELTADVQVAQGSIAAVHSIVNSAHAKAEGRRNHGWVGMPLSEIWVQHCVVLHTEWVA